MIILVAGLPAAHYNRIQQRAPILFGAGHVFLSAPLRPDADGVYRPNRPHADHLITTLANRVVGESALLNKGIGVMILAPAGGDATACAEAFRPFALTTDVVLPIPMMTQGRQGDMSANAIGEALRLAFPALAKAVDAMMTEMEARQNRSPLLLPLRNFASNVLRPTIAALWDGLVASPDPNAAIAAACRQVEAVHPYGRIAGSNRRCFEDDRRIQFRSPARAHHGMAASIDPPHNKLCFLNGNVRLGGRFAAGFHYDCIKDFSGGNRELPLTTNVHDCHDAPDRLTGNPHINIAPNDFCRV